MGGESGKWMELLVQSERASGKVLWGKWTLRKHKSASSFRVHLLLKIVKYELKEFCIIFQNYGNHYYPLNGEPYLHLCLFPSLPNIGYLDTQNIFFFYNLWTIRHLGLVFKRISYYKNSLKHLKKVILALFYHSKIVNWFDSHLSGILF